uniref:Uncharacterized protein n=1 Tax=Globisporangium ultimum (strain ATCC 200006 / CBS 805.95 / DAOM BR144) TaxID=431595 RepID=K3XAW1_GLOUD
MCDGTRRRLDALPNARLYSLLTKRSESPNVSLDSSASAFSFEISGAGVDVFVLNVVNVALGFLECRDADNAQWASSRTVLLLLLASLFSQRESPLFGFACHAPPFLFVLHSCIVEWHRIVVRIKHAGYFEEIAYLRLHGDLAQRRVDTFVHKLEQHVIMFASRRFVHDDFAMRVEMANGDRKAVPLRVVHIRVEKANGAINDLRWVRRVVDDTGARLLCVIAGGDFSRWRCCFCSSILPTLLRCQRRRRRIAGLECWNRELQRDAAAIVHEPAKRQTRRRFDFGFFLLNLVQNIERERLQDHVLFLFVVMTICFFRLTDLLQHAERKRFASVLAVWSALFGILRATFSIASTLLGNTILVTFKWWIHWLWLLDLFLFRNLDAAQLILGPVKVLNFVVQTKTHVILITSRLFSRRDFVVLIRTLSVTQLDGNLVFIVLAILNTRLAHSKRETNVARLDGRILERVVPSVECTCDHLVAAHERKVKSNLRPVHVLAVDAEHRAARELLSFLASSEHEQQQHLLFKHRRVFNELVVVMLRRDDAAIDAKHIRQIQVRRVDLERHLHERMILLQICGKQIHKVLSAAISGIEAARGDITGQVARAVAEPLLPWHRCSGILGVLGTVSSSAAIFTGSHVTVPS